MVGDMHAKWHASSSEKDPFGEFTLYASKTMSWMELLDVSVCQILTCYLLRVIKSHGYALGGTFHRR
jgi:hypothetical protein